MAAIDWQIVLFDDGLGQFGPLTDLRAPFELRTGVQTLVESLAPAALWARSDLAPLLAARHGLPVNELPARGDSFFLINGRVTSMPPHRVARLRGRALVDAATGATIAALLDRARSERFLREGARGSSGLDVDEVEGTTLLARPWDIVEPEALARRLTDELTWKVKAARSGYVRRPTGVVIGGRSGVWIHRTARVSRGVILDTEGGPIGIGEGAVIRPGAVIVGPASIGAHSTVLERTVIKARTVIGPHCKVAGEVGNTIFQGFANKAHDGHLGDSFVGEWVNLGAGTTNSNLLNTYSEVSLRLEADAPIERTGRQFVGAVIGDHVKTAILTRLPTGCVIGTGSMIATTRFAPALVPRFSWLTDEGSRLYRIEKFLEVARAAWARRGITSDAATRQAIEALRRLHARAAPRQADPERSER